MEHALDSLTSEGQSRSEAARTAILEAERAHRRARLRAEAEELRNDSDDVDFGNCQPRKGPRARSGWVVQRWGWSMQARMPWSGCVRETPYPADRVHEPVTFHG